MYGWLWRTLPGPRPVKGLTSLVLVVGVVALLWFMVFPWAEPLLPFGDVTVPEGASPSATDLSPSGSPAPAAS
jgi:hypothetical protein